MSKTQKQLSLSENHMPKACDCFLIIILRLTRGLKSLAILPKKFRIVRQIIFFCMQAQSDVH